MIIIILACILVADLLLYGLMVIYYLLYPDKTYAKVLNPSLITGSGNKGLSGYNGGDGVLNDLAINGMVGRMGEQGAVGISGEKSIVVGTKGTRGIPGRNGIPGITGSPGVGGVSSNAIIPFLSHSSKSSVYDHEFNHKGILHKLTVSFVFEDVSYFSLAVGGENSRFEINTFMPGLLPVYSPTTGTSIGNAKKIYSSLRVILENKSSDTDGTVVYTSAPINRDGYLLLATSNLSAGKFEENIIDKNKEFGLDFGTVSASKFFPSKYNFMVRGILRYRAIFNIYPYAPDLFPRIEERISSNPVKDFSLHKLTNEAKGNAVKLSNTSLIYLLSPRLSFGKVVYKDSSNNKNLWEVQKYTDITESLNNVYPKILQSLDFLENDQNTFKDGYAKANDILVFSKYDRAPITPNIIIRAKQAQTAPIVSTMSIPSGYDNFSTKIVVNNLRLVYPNTESPLTLPSILTGCKFHLRFYLRIKIASFEDYKYYIYLASDKTRPIIVNDGRSVVISTLLTNELNNAQDVIPTGYDRGYIYCPVEILSEDGLLLEKFFGRRVILKLSSASVDVDCRYGGVSNFYTGLSTRHNGQTSDIAFEGSNTDYDFQSGTDNVEGFDFTAASSKFDVAANIFSVGYYKDDGTLKSLRVIGTRASNGDYFLDVPVSGY